MPDLPMRPLDDDDLPEVEVVASEQPKPPRDPETWAPIKAGLEESFEEFVFHIWLEPLELVVRRRGELVVAAPRHVRSSVQARYGPKIARIAEAVLREKVQITVVSQEWFPAE
jgi:hypothetical protein